MFSSGLMNSSSDQDIITKLAANLSTPMPVSNQVQLVLPLDCFDGVAREIYDMFANLLFSSYAAGNHLTQDEFVSIVRYILKMRLDVIYRGACFGGRDDRVAFSPIEMPNCLAVLINSIGVATVREGTRRVIPIQPPAPTDPTDYIRSPFTDEVYTRFYAFNHLLSHQLNVRLGQLSRSIEGTSYWFLKVVCSDGRVPTTRDVNNLRVETSFSEFTPSDEILACILQRGVAEDPIDDRSVYFMGSTHSSFSRYSFYHRA